MLRTGNWWASRIGGGYVFLAGAASLFLAQLSVDRGIGLRSTDLWLAGLAGAVLCVIAWVLPWGSLPEGSSLGVPLAALGLLLLVDRLGAFTTSAGAAAAYPVYLVLVLMLVGLSQPRSTALAFSLCAGSVAAYALARHTDPALEVRSLLVILPVGVALGEAVAWLVGRGNRLDHLQRRREGDLQRLTAFLVALAAEPQLDRAAALVAVEATELFGAPGATVVLTSAGGERAVARHGRTEGARRTIPLIGGHRDVGRVELFLDEAGSVDQAGRDRYVADLSQLFAIQVGTTVSQLHTISELGRAANRDDLTGTGNRRHATELLGTLAEGDALLVVDLDRFKSVNDTWGHRAGDEILHDLGTYLQACVRSSDDVARLGGDEFVVVARAAGRDATGTAERLLRGWRQGGHRTTASIGVALYRPGEAAEDTLDRADAALYAAKSEGRDRIARAED